VIVFRNSEIGFGDKEQDESQGPVQCLCLDRIMTLLSPVEDIPGPGSAANWRAQVAAVKAERTAANRRVGDTIRLPARHISRRPASAPTGFTVIAIPKPTVILAPTSHTHSAAACDPRRLRRPRSNDEPIVPRPAWPDDDSG
jgi:hypothetical protein